MQRRNFFTRLSALALAIALGLGSSFSSNAVSVTAASVSMEEAADLNYEELMKAQERAVAANEILMQYFYSIGDLDEYPEYYGGCYIGDDNLYHLRLVASSDGVKETLNILFGEYADVVIYETCDISFNELQEYVRAVADDIMDLGYDVTSWCVDVTTGNVIVRVLPDCVEAVQAMVDNGQGFSYTYKSVGLNGSDEAVSSNYTCPSIIVEQGAYMRNDSSPVLGGNAIGINGAGYSVGACGYYNGQNAIVTAGHGVAVDDVVMLNGVNIGTAARVQFTSNQEGDYALVILNNEAELSHRIGNSERGITILNKGIVNDPAVGTYIQKYGNTSGYAYGQVKFVNVEATEQRFGVTLKRLTEAILTSGSDTGGDSGGPYLVQGAFCGVHSGSTGIVGDGYQYVFFTPYTCIADAGFTVISRHECSSWSDAGPVGHSGYCKVCKEVVVESHSDYWNSAIGRCTRCGRTDPIFVAID